MVVDESYTINMLETQGSILCNVTDPLFSLRENKIHNDLSNEHEI